MAKNKLNDMQKEKIFEAINEYFQEETPSYSLNDIANNVGVNLGTTINEMKSDSFVQQNQRVMRILEQYQDAIDHGAYEERLYETFIHSLSPYTSYMTGLQLPLKTLKDRIENSKVEIDLTKILESMLETTSYYIVPLIEENVATYVKEKTPNHRVQLMSNLAAFAADPYVKLMIEAINLDNDKATACVSESKVISAKDKIKFIHEHADVADIYSPIQYLKDNSCVFSINGKFYLKNGSSISKFDVARNGDQLSESFIHLTQLINDPRVSIKNNTITFAANNKVVTINENGVEINGKPEALTTFNDLNTIAMIYEDYDLRFWNDAKVLAENFDNIANVDFAKHVELYDDDNISFDLMKLSENLFVATHNNILNEHIFYKNVNPIQCRNIINEHMGMNVSDLFENLLPNQDALMKKIFETTNAYEEAINKYDSEISKLEAVKDKAEGEERTKLDKMLNDLQDKKKDLENEYGEFQSKSKELTDAKEEDDEEGKKVEVSDEPLKSSEVDDAKDELSEPLSDEGTSDVDSTADEYSLENDIDDSAISDEDMNAAIADVIKTDYSDEANVNAEPEAEDNSENEDEFFPDSTQDDWNDDESGEAASDVAHVDADENSTKVIDIAFHQNILDGTVHRSGVAYVSIPLLDGDGNLSKDIKLFNFNISPEGVVTMENDEQIPYDLYKTVVSAIESHPDYNSMESTSSDVPAEGEELPADIAAEVPEDTVEGENDFDNDFADDTVSEITDEISDEVDIPSDINIDDTEEMSFDDFSSDASTDPVKTYEKDGTEIEMPAANKDESKIKESLDVKGKKALNELNALYDDEETPELEEEEVKLTPEEMMDIMSQSFSAAAENALENDDVEIDVTDNPVLTIEFDDPDTDPVDVESFTVANVSPDEDLKEADEVDELSEFVVYKIDDAFYSRPKSEFDEICDNYEGEELHQALVSEYDDPESPLNPVLPENEDDCIDIMTTVMNNIAGDSYSIEDIASESIEDLKNQKAEEMDENYDIFESIKIKLKNKLKADETGDSVKDKETEDPTSSEESKEAEKKKDDAEKEASEENKANEAFKPTLPNQKKNLGQMTTEAFHQRGTDWFNVNDKVLYKPLKNAVGVIYAVEQDGTYDILLNDGTKVYGVTNAQLEPKNRSTKDIGYVDLPQTDLSAPKETDYKDLNKRVDANIVADGYRMNNESYQALLSDVYSKRPYIHIMNESGIDDRYPRENVEICAVPQEDWKWAVYTVDDDLEPDRKVQVDPCSWNEAAKVCDTNPDCNVKCLMRGEVVELPYKYIKFIA